MCATIHYLEILLCLHKLGRNGVVVGLELLPVFGHVRLQITDEAAQNR